MDGQESNHTVRDLHLNCYYNYGRLVIFKEKGASYVLQYPHECS